MFKYSVLILFVLGCSALPVDQDVSGEGSSLIKDYRVAVEKYLSSIFHWKTTPSQDEPIARYFLYTKQEPHPVELNTEDFAQSLRNSSYDLKRPVKILIHEWLLSKNDLKELVTAYLRHYHTAINVIVVDYSQSSTPEYKSFMNRYELIGKSVGKFLNELNKYGVEGDQIHIIGHGNGAHIAAVAARKVTPFQVNRITGLDPVGVQFDKKKALIQLQKRDASFVDIITTNMGEIGSTQAHRGHANFYPNGGVSLPDNTMLVSHMKSYYYFVESVVRSKSFRSYPAESYTDFRAGKYDKSKDNYMGEYSLKNVSGDFYLDVNPLPPYSTTFDAVHQSHKNKRYETYFNLLPKDVMQPWGYSPQEETYLKKAKYGEGNVESNENSEFAGHYEHELKSSKAMMM